MRTALLLALLLSPAAGAHEFWLEPATYRPAAGDTVALRVFVGAAFVGDALPNIPDWFTRFEARGPDGDHPVAGNIGDEPAGRLTVTAPGTWLVGYESVVTPARIPAERFQFYLNDSGLINALRLREERGETGEPGREVYTRYAKTQLQTADAPPGDGAGKRFGFPLEIIPLADTRELDRRRLPVRVLLNDAPLAGGLVIAWQRDRPGRIEQRTDAAGEALLPLDRPGPWLLNVVHIEYVGGELADWESFWASLTLQVD